ncbi:MAG: hypothetical protein AAF702_48105 [Chloroflexota bacterium]
MKERPIIFSGDMVRVILDGKKTQTRRVIKPQPEMFNHGFPCTNNDGMITCPYGEAGDLLWVKENAWISPAEWCKRDDATHFDYEDKARVVQYEATVPDGWAAGEHGIKKRSSLLMPKWASRIRLKVEDVRVERVQEIINHFMDVRKEGIPATGGHGEFAWVWDKINAKRGYSWDSDPWVWVIDFSVVEVKEGANGGI